MPFRFYQFLSEIIDIYIQYHRLYSIDGILHILVKIQCVFVRLWPLASVNQSCMDVGRDNSEIGRSPTRCNFTLYDNPMMIRSKHFSVIGDEYILLLDPAKLLKYACSSRNKSGGNGRSSRCFLRPDMTRLKASNTFILKYF